MFLANAVNFSEDFVFVHDLWFHQFRGSANVRTHQPYRLASRCVGEIAAPHFLQHRGRDEEQKALPLCFPPLLRGLPIRCQQQVPTAPRHQITWDGGFEIEPGFQRLMPVQLVDLNDDRVIEERCRTGFRSELRGIGHIPSACRRQYPRGTRARNTIPTSMGNPTDAIGIASGAQVQPCRGRIIRNRTGSLEAHPALYVIRRMLRQGGESHEDFLPGRNADDDRGSGAGSRRPVSGP